MVEETAVEVKTKDQLLAELDKAMKSGEWKQISKISSEIAKVQAGAEKAAKDANQAALVGITEQIKGILDKAVAKFIDTVDGELLGVMDGVWYAQDFGENLTSCRVSKGAARKSGGGGGGTKFNVSTSELLSRHGSEMMGDSGKTFQQAYDEDTGGNARYKVRMKLLKAEGLS